MSKKYLTLDDLYAFFANNQNSVHFSSTDTGQSIVVHINGSFEAKSESTLGLMPVTLKSCHINLNRNGSYISEENMLKALPSFANRPILGNIIQLDDGSYDFHSHDIEINEETDTILYIEKPIGIIPESCNAHLEYDKEMDKTYVIVTGFVYEDYGNQSADILRSKDSNPVSVELCINELSYNAKEKRLELEDFYFNGVTCLGSEPDGTKIGEGMQGSKLTIDNFSAKENSFVDEDYQKKVIELLDKLDTTLSNFNISDASKGGKKTLKFEELLAKYNKSLEDIDFEYDGLSDDELEAKFTEAFGSIAEDKPIEENNDVPEPINTFTKGCDYLVDSDGNATVTFKISHEDIRSALYHLLDTYACEDNEWYFIDSVFDNYFEYSNWEGNKIYRQTYAKDGDNISFEGERISLYQERLTASEKEALDEMRANYVALKEFKAQVLEVKKSDIINSETYSVLKENKAFMELKEHLNDYTVEAVETKCKLIFADYVLSQGTYEQKIEVAKNKINFNLNETTKKKPYGSLFD